MPPAKVRVDTAPCPLYTMRIMPSSGEGDVPESRMSVWSAPEVAPPMWTKEPEVPSTMVAWPPFGVGNCTAPTKPLLSTSLEFMVVESAVPASTVSLAVPPLSRTVKAPDTPDTFPNVSVALVPMTRDNRAPGAAGTPVNRDTDPPADAVESPAVMDTAPPVPLSDWPANSSRAPPA